MLRDTIGISLGTRSIGIAVMRKGGLLNWQVKSFKGKMNQQKLYMISGALLKFIRDNNSNTVVLKMPHRDHTYETVSVLKRHLIKSLIEHKVTVYIYSLSEIKAAFNFPITNKQGLMRWGVNNYKELGYAFKKERKNKNSYHLKVFEAVIVLHVHIHRI